MYSDVIYGSVESSDIIIDEKEFQKRIGCKYSLDSEIVLSCREALERSLDCKFSYVCINLSFSQPDICDLSFTEIKSNDLYKNLKNCRQAYIMAVTLGIGVDRLLTRLKIKSPGEYFITDALASAAAEALCNYTEYNIKHCENECDKVMWRPRYSPGYGDCSIKNQKPLLERLDAERHTGIVLNDSYFMTPSKSITAIMGKRYEENN